MDTNGLVAFGRANLPLSSVIAGSKFVFVFGAYKLLQRYIIPGDPKIYVGIVTVGAEKVAGTCVFRPSPNFQRPNPTFVIIGS
jgi:hypothetical protein